LCVVPGSNFCFYFRDIGPAIRSSLVAIGAQQSVGRVGGANSVSAAVEYVPAALAWRRFLSPACHDRAPIGRNEIHVRAKTTQQIHRYIAISLLIWNVLRRH